MGWLRNKLGWTRRARISLLVLLIAALVLGGLAYVSGQLWPVRHPRPVATPDRPTGPKSRRADFERFSFWFGEVPLSVRERCPDTGGYSNVRPEDYTAAGPAACAECHSAQFRAWSRHPHRWMNAAATPSHVKGDFTSRLLFGYLGGEGHFWREGDHFRMAAQRGKLRREFRITRTIGSRYFEYYVGVQTAGPEPAGDERYRVEHVLPFGYWLTRRQWVPTVHIREERADDADDPKLNPYEDFYFRSYDDICARCHTTLPIGDWLVRAPYDAGRYTPYPFGMDLGEYLERERPGLLPAPLERMTTGELEKLVEGLVDNRPPARILHLGIVCEACHNGCKPHVADPEHIAPHFFPASPILFAELPRENPHGRTHANVNWICARCHVGPRPQFPGGTSTWNSAEYSDAKRGSCYSQLRCVDCHNPHQAIGPMWPHPPDHDDGLCLKCHRQYGEATARRRHTRHAPGSEGDRCMNCHMPRINEGLDTVVRTHTIFSPTNAALIEKNGPNACNLCHLDQSINWTLRYLREWYGRSYNEGEIDRNYASREEPMGHVWLRHPFRATRLVAAAAYGRQKNPRALPALLDILDDRYLLNRQFGQMAVEEITSQPLQKRGYRFTMSPEERGAVLPKVRAALVPIAEKETGGQGDKQIRR